MSSPSSPTPSPGSEGLVHQINRYLYGTNGPPKLPKPRATASDRLGVFVAIVISMCAAAIALAGTIWFLVWLFS